MNIRMTTNSQIHKYQQLNLKKKNLEQEQNHRNGDHMEHCQYRGGEERMREKVQRISSINDRNKINRGRLTIV